METASRSTGDSSRGWEDLEFQLVFHVESAWRREGSRVTLEPLPVPGGADRKDGEGLFTRGCSDRTRGNGCKLKEGRFRLDSRKKFFPMRMVKHWSRLPREAVAAPSMAGFKARLDGALSNLVQWKMSLLMAGVGTR